MHSSKDYEHAQTRNYTQGVLGTTILHIIAT